MKDNKINKLLKYVDDLHEKSEEEIETEKKKKFTDILSLIEKFLIDKKIVLYGGTAMNMYLPKKHKFYKDYELPDYDGFCVNPEKVALELVNILKKNSYEYITIRHALHDGTFKITWEFNDIADFSKISYSDYKLILKNSSTINNLKVANINLIKCNAYYELCLPKSAMFRWSKVFKRIMILEKNVAIKTVQYKSDYWITNKVPIIKIILDHIVSYVIKNEYVLSGMKALLYYMNENIFDHKHLHENTRYLQFWADNVDQSISDVTNILMEHNVKYKVYNSKSNSFIPDKKNIDVVINDKRIRLISIVNTYTNCFSYKTIKVNKKNIRICTVPFMLYLFYYYLYVHNNTASLLSIKCTSLISKLVKKINNDDFVTECYGFHKSTSAIKKSRAKKKIGLVYKDSILK